jgi:hypothetical protein
LRLANGFFISLAYVASLVSMLRIRDRRLQSVRVGLSSPSRALQPRDGHDRDATAAHSTYPSALSPVMHATPCIADQRTDQVGFVLHSAMGAEAHPDLPNQRSTVRDPAIP